MERESGCWISDEMMLKVEIKERGWATTMTEHRTWIVKDYKPDPKMPLQMLHNSYEYIHIQSFRGISECSLFDFVRAATQTISNGTSIPSISTDLNHHYKHKSIKKPLSWILPSSHQCNLTLKNPIRFAETHLPHPLPKFMKDPTTLKQSELSSDSMVLKDLWHRLYFICSLERYLRKMDPWSNPLRRRGQPLVLLHLLAFISKEKASRGT